MAIANCLIISPSICFNRTVVQASNSRGSRGKVQTPKAVANDKSERRNFILLSAAALSYHVTNSQTDLLNKYLKKSEENKVKNDKERLDSYYKRNYRDYFGLLEGDLNQRKDISESEKRILEWLQSNK